MTTPAPKLIAFHGKPEIKAAAAWRTAKEQSRMKQAAKLLELLAAA